MANGYGLVVVTKPAVEPVTLDEAKDAIGVRGSAFDSKVSLTITAARVRLEKRLGMSFINTTRRMSFDAWPTSPGIIYPPYTPLSSVSSITYVDTAGDTQTWGADQYQVDTDSDPGRLTLAYAATWPSLRGDLAGVKITYVSGYGSAASDVPDEYRVAILDLVRVMYDLPGEYPSALPASVEQLLPRGVYG